MKNIPLPFIWFYLLISVCALFLIGLPVCPWIQRAVMGKFHLRASSFAQWSTLQIIPSMYNFSHQLRVVSQSVDPLRPAASTENISRLPPTWLNHYPFWPVTFGQRGMFFQEKENHDIYLHSRFQQQELWTIYRMDTRGKWKKLDAP